jgi:hypothetical protein
MGFAGAGAAAGASAVVAPVVWRAMAFNAVAKKVVTTGASAVVRFAGAAKKAAGKVMSVQSEGLSVQSEGLSAMSCESASVTEREREK